MSLRDGAIEAMRRAGSGRHSRTTADARARLDALVAYLTDLDDEAWFAIKGKGIVGPKEFAQVAAVLAGETSE
jgi:hypothetical protein